METSEPLFKPLFSYRKYWAASLRHGAVPADVAGRDGRAGLGFLRRHHRHRRRLRRSPELRHGASSAGCSRRRASASASSRSPTGTAPTPFKALGKPNLFFGVTAGNMDSMVNRYTSDRRDPHATTRTRRAAWAASAPTAPSIVYAQRCREAFNDVPDRHRRHRRHRCAASRTTTTGRRRCAARSCSMPRPTCCCSAMPNAPSSRSRIAWPPASRSRDHRPARHRLRAQAHGVDRDRFDAIDTPGRSTAIDPYAMEPRCRKANDSCRSRSGQRRPIVAAAP